MLKAVQFIGAALTRERSRLGKCRLYDSICDQSIPTASKKVDKVDEDAGLHLCSLWLGSVPPRSPVTSRAMLSHFRGSPVTKPVVLETKWVRHCMRLIVEDSASQG